MKRDVLYCEINGNIVSAYESWRRGAHLNTETSITFSGQVFEACEAKRLSLFAVSYCSAKSKRIRDESYAVENRKRWDLRIPIVGYELSMILYALRLFFLALRVRPSTIVIGHGTSEWLYLSILFLTGAKIIPVFHNTLWPHGYPPTGPMAWYRRTGEQLFWRSSPAILAVSWAVAEQIRSKNVLVFKPSFPAFEVPETRPWQAPIRILFAGRLEENKGIYDVLEIAKRLPHVQFAICGDGRAFDEVKGSNVLRLGRLKRDELIRQYVEAHLVIVPTRSSFAEGFCMVVAEALLMLRPVVTNAVVPAARMFREAVVLAQTDNVDSYVEAITQMTAERYHELVNAARKLRLDILDDSASFYARLYQVI